MTKENAVFLSEEAHGWLSSYEYYLISVRGLTSNSIRLYMRIATKLISEIAEGGTLDWQALDAGFVAKFVLSETAQRRGKGVSVVATVVRSLLRFLVSRYVVRTGLELAIPRLKTYRNAGIPQHLSKRQLKQLINSAEDGSAIGRRDFAILLLLSKFGLRGGEVANLELRDIDWTNGEILVRTSKTHVGRKLPLLKSVGEALLQYLRGGRPLTGNGRIFLQHAQPFRAISASSISKIVGRRIAKAGIRTKRTGSHILRHSIATELINNGASFKDIADLLGHKTIESTAIYAKVDLKTLANIGLPWPGGELK